MKEIYEAMNRLEIVRIKAQEIINADDALLTIIDSINAKLLENEQIYNALRIEAEELNKNVKILDLIYFCQTGKFLNEN